MVAARIGVHGLVIEFQIRIDSLYETRMPYDSP
jgi:hypothetical protein